MKHLFVASVVAGALSALAPGVEAAACTPTGFIRDSINMTAALINPVGTVSGVVDAAGCNIGIYYDHTGSGGTVNAEVKNSNYFGVLVNGDAGIVGVDVLNSNIHDIGESPLNGGQHGVAIYYRGFSDSSAVTGKVSGNRISKYQKGGIVANGPATQVAVSDNTVVGEGHISYIAQNGVQIGYGASASVMRNTVSGNSYVGLGGWSSGGILVLGGACYQGALTTGIQIVQNTLANNDVGVYLSNGDSDGDFCSAPADPTNVKVVNNTISSDLCFNAAYQAGVSDVGNNDKIINNKISGPGYVGCSTAWNPAGVAVDAALSFTNRPKVHANK
ncbi:MAG: hypothetical protein ABIQ86_01100 [Steroidobacteraceae bacterium]